MQEMKEDDLIQKHIVKKAIEDLEWGKNKIREILIKGEGIYWNSKKKWKELFYRPIINSSIPPLYKDRKRGIDKTSEGIDGEEKSLQPIDNKVTFSIPNTPLETRKGEDIKEEECQEVNAV